MDAQAKVPKRFIEAIIGTTDGPFFGARKIPPFFRRPSVVRVHFDALINYMFG